MPYNEKILNYFHNTSHAVLQGDPANTYSVEVGHTENSDVLKLFLQIQNETISTARFKAHGSPVLIAMAEFFCRFIENKSIDDVARIQHPDLLTELQLTTLHVHVAALVLSATKKILENYSPFNDGGHAKYYAYEQGVV